MSHQAGVLWSRSSDKVTKHIVKWYHRLKQTPKVTSGVKSQQILYLLCKFQLYHSQSSPHHKGLCHFHHSQKPVLHLKLETLLTFCLLVWQWQWLTLTRPSVKVFPIRLKQLLTVSSPILYLPPVWYVLVCHRCQRRTISCLWTGPLCGYITTCHSMLFNVCNSIYCSYSVC